MQQPQAVQLLSILGLFLWVGLSVTAAFRLDRRVVRLSAQRAGREAMVTGLLMGLSGTIVLMAGTVVEDTLQYWVGHLVLGVASGIMFGLFLLASVRRRRSAVRQKDDGAAS